MKQRLFCLDEEKRRTKFSMLRNLHQNWANRYDRMRDVCVYNRTKMFCLSVHLILSLFSFNSKLHNGIFLSLGRAKNPFWLSFTSHHYSLIGYGVIHIGQTDKCSSWFWIVLRIVAESYKAISHLSSHFNFYSNLFVTCQPMKTKWSSERNTEQEIDRMLKKFLRTSWTDSKCLMWLTYHQNQKLNNDFNSMGCLINWW